MNVNTYDETQENRQIYILLGLLIFLVTAPSAYVWIFRSYLSKLLLFQPHIPNSSVLSGLWFTLSNGSVFQYLNLIHFFNSFTRHSFEICNHVCQGSHSFMDE